MTEHRLRLTNMLTSTPAEQRELELSLKTVKADLQRLYQRRLKAGLIPQEADNATSIVVSRRAIRNEIRGIIRAARLSWNRVTDLGETRANGFAGEVARRIEALRAQYPGYEIALVLEHRQERSPSKAVWSQSFNRLVMSSGGANVHNKVKETCSRLDPPIAVFERATHGFAACDLNENGMAPVNVVQVGFGANGKSAQSDRGELALQTYAQRSIVRRERIKDGKTILTFSAVDTSTLVAENMIVSLVTPSRLERIPAKPAIAACQKSLFQELPHEVVARLVNS